MITQHYMIDLIPAGDPLIVHASQYDKEARILAFDLYVGGVAFEMPAGATAQIRGTKPDDTVFSYAMDIDGTTVSIPIAQQMALVAGDVPCEIRITGDGSSHLGTANFILRIERSALDEEAAESASDIPLFEQLVNEATEAATEARTAAGDAEAAQTAAEAAQSAAETLIPASGTAGQVLTKTSTGTAWEDIVMPSGASDLMIHVNYVPGTGYSVDHTYAEALQNISDGGTPVMEYRYNSGNPTYYLLRSYTDTFMIFGTPQNGSVAIMYLYATGGVASGTVLYAQSTTVTVPASSWTNGQATISWGSITATCVVELGYPVGTTDADYQIMRDADIRVIGQAAGNITIKALGTVPTSDLTFQLSRV